MKIIKIEKENISNGPGIRTVIWVSGCEHRCKNCHNPETWDYNKGLPLDYKAVDQILSATDKEYVSGITFTGGDPLSIRNRKDVIALARELSSRFPTKNIWCWTGHTFEEISMIQGIEVFDVIVDGKFEIDKKDLTLPWRGSSNQRIIDVKKSIKSNSIVEIL